MTRLSPRHPRYASLRTRARLARALRQGLIVPEGLIAHGRAEAFDYWLGERTTPSARRAERLAARWIRAAERPVISVNGNVAALAAQGVARLQRRAPKLGVEVNLFHRRPARVRAVARALRAAGVRRVLGLRPGARIPGLPSDRARVDARGIARADLCIVPLEDGDRTEALRAIGKRVIAIDLNPWSRTARYANLAIVDELTRALDGIARGLGRSAGETARRGPKGFGSEENPWAIADAIREMRRRLPSTATARTPRRRREAPARSGGPPRRGIARRTRRRR